MMYKKQLPFQVLLLVFSSLWVSMSAQNPDAQGFTPVPLQDLSPFRAPDSNWKIAGAAHADFTKDDALSTAPGIGVLVNLPDSKSRGNLTFQLEHGDMDLELEFMMARHSNSGIYLQGRYEVQLFDSWGVANPSFSDCGGIYQRWDDALPEGQKGYQGYAPRINACRAPGLWQKLHISFQAPRFDAAGRKIANARILRIELNGAVLHENLELTGPTRGQAFPGESATGALFFQGDHGPVAFRNIRYKKYDGESARLENLQYAVYQGDYRVVPDFKTLTPKATGKTAILTQEVARMNEKLLLRYTGVFKAPKAGNYRFKLNAFGSGLLRINGQEIIPFAEWTQEKQANLPAGDLPFELVYAKPDNWFPNGLALEVEGPGFRNIALQSFSSLAPPDPTRPIINKAGTETVILRSFSDFSSLDTGSTHRIVRAINVGFPENLSYSYNAANGAQYQVWKGGFLDATPMWNSRGDGNSVPDGVVLKLQDAPTLVQINKAEDVLPDTLPAAANFRALGYNLDKTQTPEFQYQSWGATVSDKTTYTENGNGLTRNLEAKNVGSGALYFRLASGQTIEALSDKLYLIDGKYYIRLENAAKASIRAGKKQTDLIVPAQNGAPVRYSLIW
ncbi:MAG: family 16 glycoside hydrolase [Bacteroidota bacterium]